MVGANDRPELRVRDPLTLDVVGAFNHYVGRDEHFVVWSTHGLEKPRLRPLVCFGRSVPQNVSYRQILSPKVAAHKDRSMTLKRFSLGARERDSVLSHPR